MQIEHLEPDEIALIGACLKAAAHGPFFPDWEFETLLGLSRQQIAFIAGEWPANAAAPRTETAVLNALVNLSGYPHGREDELRRIVSAPEALPRLLKKLQAGACARRT
jgi:hypothetical protein